MRTCSRLGAGMVRRAKEQPVSLSLPRHVARRRCYATQQVGVWFREDQGQVGPHLGYVSLFRACARRESCLAVFEARIRCAAKCSEDCSVNHVSCTFFLDSSRSAATTTGPLDQLNRNQWRQPIDEKN